MTDKEKEIAIYCLKASSGYHSEVCEECVKYPICDHTMQDDVIETIIKALEQQPCEDLINQRATTCRHGGHCEWVACDKCNHYEPDPLSQQPCEDCISRQAVDPLVDELARAISDERCCMSRGRSTATIMQDILDLPSVTPKAKEKTEWIPVSERLPKEHTCADGFIDPSEYVLVQMKSGYMKVSRYWGSRERYRDRPWINLDYPTTDDVVAWMPLPAPFEPQESEE